MSETRLQLTLLGGFKARWASGVRVKLANKKTQGLLACLALPAGKAQSRERLMGLLWSDRAEPQARNSLRQALAELSRALGLTESSPLVKEQDRIALDLASVEVDAMAFERFAASDKVEELRQAAALYDGDLLEGIGIRDAAFEEWLLLERQRLRNLVVIVLKKLLDRETGQEAIASARRLLALDPLQEDGHRALMRLHTEADEIGAALRQYRTCRETLQRELGVGPSPETEALHRQIRSQPAKSMEPGGDRTAPIAVPAHERGGASLESKPSIAVLPFVNMSGDPEQTYFTDGITEDIITELSRFRSLFVIARKSSFQYRGRDIDVKHIGGELGVRYVVEGSVRRVGKHVRITAQLIEAATGNHIWADRFDRDLVDIFAVQDEVTRSVVSRVAARLEDEELQMTRRKPPRNMRAYDLCLQGRRCLALWTAEGNAEAGQLFEQAIAIDPTFARAYAGLAASRLWGSWYSAWDTADHDLRETAWQFARRAAALDDTDHVPHIVMAWVDQHRREYDQARRHLDRALTLNPNDADALAERSMMLTCDGEPEAGKACAETAIRLNPHHPDQYLAYLAAAYFFSRNFGEVIRLRAALTEAFPDGQAFLAAAYALTGNMEKASENMEAFLRRYPSHWKEQPSAHRFVGLYSLKREEDVNLAVEGLRKAGMPE